MKFDELSCSRRFALTSTADQKGQRLSFIKAIIKIVAAVFPAVFPSRFGCTNTIFLEYLHFCTHWYWHCGLKKHVRDHVDLFSTDVIWTTFLSRFFYKNVVLWCEKYSDDLIIGDIIDDAHCCMWSEWKVIQQIAALIPISIWPHSKIFFPTQFLRLHQRLLGSLIILAVGTAAFKGWLYLTRLSVQTPSKDKYIH